MKSFFELAFSFHVQHQTDAYHHCLERRTVSQAEGCVCSNELQSFFTALKTTSIIHNARDLGHQHQLATKETTKSTHVTLGVRAQMRKKGS
jgi:hypothetical protein